MLLWLLTGCLAEGTLEPALRIADVPLETGETARLVDGGDALMIVGGQRLRVLSLPGLDVVRDETLGGSRSWALMDVGPTWLGPDTAIVCDDTKAVATDGVTGTTASWVSSSWAIQAGGDVVVEATDVSGLRWLDGRDVETVDADVGGAIAVNPADGVVAITGMTLTLLGRDGASAVVAFPGDRATLAAWDADGEHVYAAPGGYGWTNNLYSVAEGGTLAWTTSLRWPPNALAALDGGGVAAAVGTEDGDRILLVGDDGADRGSFAVHLEHGGVEAIDAAGDRLLVIGASEAWVYELE